MTKTTTPSPVSIHPSSFTDDQPDLSILSLEEVVARFKDTEKRRNSKTEPDNEVEVFWHIRSAPGELMSSLRVVASRLGISRSVLTKCMSRQLVDWYSNSLGLTKLSEDYNNVYSDIKRQAYSTLRVQAENPPTFSFVSRVEQIDTTASTIRWVVSKLTEMHEFVGLTAHDLFMVGLMWCLTQLENREWDKNVIERFFEPEVYNFETLVVDRSADLMALQMKFQHREATNYNDHIFAVEGRKD